MVGIYAKIKNGLNWLKGKAAKYVAPVIGTIGDIANNPFVKGAAQFASPFLDSLAPGLGSGINTGLGWLGKAGNVANGLSADYQQFGDDFGFGDMLTNVVTGKYTNNYAKKVPNGIQYAKRPEELHSRIQLKALPSGDDEFTRTGSYVEEID